MASAIPERGARCWQQHGSQPAPTTFPWTARCSLGQAQSRRHVSASSGCPAQPLSIFLLCLVPPSPHPRASRAAGRMPLVLVGASSAPLHGPAQTSPQSFALSPPGCSSLSQKMEAEPLPLPLWDPRRSCGPWAPTEEPGQHPRGGGGAPRPPCRARCSCSGR